MPATMNDTDSRKIPDGYNYDVVRQFTLMTLVWGILGMGLGCSSPPSWSGRRSTSTCPGPASAASARSTPAW